MLVGSDVAGQRREVGVHRGGGGLVHVQTAGRLAVGAVVDGAGAAGADGLAPRRQVDAADVVGLGRLDALLEGGRDREGLERRAGLHALRAAGGQVDLQRLVVAAAGHVRDVAGRRIDRHDGHVDRVGLVLLRRRVAVAGRPGRWPAYFCSIASASACRLGTERGLDLEALGVDGVAVLLLEVAAHVVDEVRVLATGRWWAAGRRPWSGRPACRTRPARGTAALAVLVLGLGDHPLVAASRRARAPAGSRPRTGPRGGRSATATG